MRRRRKRSADREYSCDELRVHFEVENAARQRARGYERAIATDVADAYLRVAREKRCPWALRRSMAPVEPDEPAAGPEDAARAFSESIRGVHQALRVGDCQDAADRFADAGDWYADVVRFAGEGAYDETLISLWEERYKGAYDELEAVCDVRNLELNGSRR